MYHVRALYLASAAFLILSTVIAFEAILGSEAKNISTLVAAASVLAATAGWVFTNALNLSSNIRNRTFIYLDKVNGSQLLTEKTTALGKLWNSEKIDIIVSKPNGANLYFIEEYHRSEIVRLLREVGNILEEMAVAIRFGVVDDRILRMTFKEILAIYLIKLGPFLRAFRNDPQVCAHPYGDFAAKDIFCEAIRLGRRWHGTDFSLSN